MNHDIILKLTAEYKETIKKDWSVLRINNIEVNLQNIYLDLEEMQSPENTNQGLANKTKLPMVIREGGNLVLLGEPGSGKSTTLQFIGLCFANNDWHKSKLFVNEEKIPIRIDLQTYASTLAEPGPSFEKAINLAVREYLRQLNTSESAELISDWLRDYSLIVLLDGLDQVRDDIHESIRREILRFSASAVAEKCSIVVSSREAGFLTISSTFKEYRILPFNDNDQIRIYLNDWFLALKKEWDKVKTEEETDKLLNQLTDQPALQQILNNPLLLRISVQVYIATGKISKNRSSLYGQYIRDLWERALSRGANKNQEYEIISAIEDFAWQLHANIQPDVSPAILEVLELKIGLISKSGEKINFTHATIQEFFVGKRLLKAWQGNSSRTWKFLHPRLHLAEWREPILLMGGALSYKEIEKLVKKIFRANSPFENNQYRDLLLIAKLASESGFLDNKIVDKILGKIRFTGAETWALLNWEFEKLIVSTKYFGSPAIPVLLEILNQSQDEMMQRAAIRALKEMGQPEVVPFLHDLLKKEDNHYIVSMSIYDALARYKDKSIISEIVDMIVKGRDSVWGSGGARAFIELKASESISVLLQAIEKNADDYFEALVGTASDALSGLGLMAIPYLYQALEHKSQFVRGVAIKSFQKLGLLEAIPALVHALKDEDAGVRSYAIQALVEMNVSESATTISNIMLNDSESWVREGAAYALEVFKDKKTIDALLLAMKNENESALDAIIAIGDEEVIRKLIPDQLIPEAFEAITKNTPNSPTDHWNRKFFTVLVARRKDSITYLCNQLSNNTDPKSRSMAIEILEALKSTEAIPDLCKSLGDSDYAIKRKSLDALIYLNAGDAIPSLIKELKDKNVGFKIGVVKGLGNLRAIQAIPSLLLLKTNIHPRHEIILISWHTVVIKLFLFLQMTAAKWQLFPKVKRRFTKTKLAQTAVNLNKNAYLTLVRLQEGYNLQLEIAITLGKIGTTESLHFLREVAEVHELIRILVYYCHKIKASRLIDYLKNLEKHFDRQGHQGYEINNVWEELIISPQIITDPDKLKIYQGEVGKSKRFFKNNPRVQEFYLRTQLARSNFDDPLISNKPSPLNKAKLVALYITILILTTAFLSILNIFYGSAEFVIQEIFGQSIKAQIIANPTVTFFILFALAIVIGLLTWLSEWVKDELGK